MLTSTRVHRRFRARCCGRLLVVRNSGQCTRVQQRSGCSGRWVRLTERTAHRRPRLLVSARTSRRLASLRSVAAACRPRPTAALAVAAPSLAATPERALPAHLSRASAKALLLGEGNFSFAAALSRQHPSLRLFATSLESQEQAFGLWGAGAALQELRERPQRVEVLHSVDATKLEQSPLHGESFDAVLFSFPHCGRKGRIQLNRALLADFARSLQRSGALAAGGAAEVTLAAGQGGTGADGSARRVYGDSWMLGLQAAEGGLVLCDAEPFDEARWTALGYRPSGHYRGLGQLERTMDKRFRTVAGVVHTLLPEGSPGAVSPWPQCFDYDASFWVGRQWSGTLAGDPQAATPFAEAALAAAQAAVGPEAVHFVRLVNLWQRPEDGRVSVCLRFSYAAAAQAVTTARALLMHEAVKSGVAQAMQLLLRTRADAVAACP